MPNFDRVELGQRRPLHPWRVWHRATRVPVAASAGDGPQSINEPDLRKKLKPEAKGAMACRLLTKNSQLRHSKPRQ